MATRELTAREKALLSRAREKEEWDYVRRPPKRPVTFSEPETVEQYLGRVGLSAWRPHFQAHLPENCKGVALVRATTVEVTALAPLKSSTSTLMQASLNM